MLSIPETSTVVCKNSASRRRGRHLPVRLSARPHLPTDLQGFCETENPDLIQAIADQDGYFVVVFSWTADGVPGIGNSTQSFYIPKYARPASF
jgi:hypothetical protein